MKMTDAAACVTERIITDAERAADAFERGIFTRRDLAEWEQLLARARLVLEQYLADSENRGKDNA